MGGQDKQGALTNFQNLSMGAQNKRGGTSIHLGISV